MIRSWKFSEKELAKRKVQSIIKKCSSFKIGKTGMEPYTERLNEPDYSQDYKFTNIDSAFRTRDKDEVSDMEAYLIDTFKDDPKCENVKDGDASFNDNMADADIYTTYVVWK